VPDPIDELESFTTPGLTMDPLSASEVRRRGTRMRRRNHALAAIGGVAAVAIIATPLAMAATGDRNDTTPPPATHSPSPSARWVQQIPADFPLTDGMARGTASGPLAGDSGLVICGANADAIVSDDRTAGDVAGAGYAEHGSEGTEARTLTLYGDDAAAIAATDALQELVTECGTDPNGSGDTLLNEVSSASIGGDASFVVTQQAQGSDGLLSDLTTMVVVRTGSAVYVTSSHTSAGGQQVVDSEADRLARKSAPVIDAMCAFSADPC
jgi:hypothetical protein